MKHLISDDPRLSIRDLEQLTAINRDAIQHMLLKKSEEISTFVKGIMRGVETSKYYELLASFKKYLTLVINAQGAYVTDEI